MCLLAFVSKIDCKENLPSVFPLLAAHSAPSYMSLEDSDQFFAFHDPRQQDAISSNDESTATPDLSSRVI